jgi:hypothetical protein
MTIHGFIYEWTDSSNGLKYIGKHVGKPTDGYIGSGVVFRKFYNKYPERFTRKILWESNNTTSEELSRMEEVYLNQISDDELFYGNNQKYYNQVRNSAGYTSENNPMKHPEIVQRMMQTQQNNGTRSDPYNNSIKKYGKETFLRMASKRLKGNKHGCGNKGKPKSETHKDNIRKSILALNEEKQKLGILKATGTGRPRDPKYSNIIALVEEHGYKKVAEMFGVKRNSVNCRYLLAKKSASVAKLVETHET